MPKKNKRFDVVPPVVPVSPEDQLAQWTKELNGCQGPQDILKWKVLHEKIEKLKSEQSRGSPPISTNASANASQSPPSNPSLLPKTKRVKMEMQPNPPSNDYLKDLYPTSDTGSKTISQCKTLRAHEKRMAVLQCAVIPTRRNPLDACVTCHVDREVNKEAAKSVCPKCGSLASFPSHLLDGGEDLDMNHVATTSVVSMPVAPSRTSLPCVSNNPELFESLANAYQTIHVDDPSKVIATRTQGFLKTITNVSIPHHYKRALVAQRLSQELTATGIIE